MTIFNPIRLFGSVCNKLNIRVKFKFLKLCNLFFCTSWLLWGVMHTIVLYFYLYHHSQRPLKSWRQLLSYLLLAPKTEEDYGNLKKTSWILNYKRLVFRTVRFVQKVVSVLDCSTYNLKSQYVRRKSLAESQWLFPLNQWFHIRARKYSNKSRFKPPVPINKLLKGKNTF